MIGTVGGIYGIAGESLLAPILLVAGYSAYELAPATIIATFLTSLVGVVAYQVLKSSATLASTKEVTGKATRSRTAG